MGHEELALLVTVTGTSSGAVPVAVSVSANGPQMLVARYEFVNLTTAPAAKTEMLVTTVLGTGWLFTTLTFWSRMSPQLLTLPEKVTRTWVVEIATAVRHCLVTWMHGLKTLTERVLLMLAGSS